MSFDDVLTLETEREAVGNALQLSLKAVVESVASKPVNVSALGRRLGLNRVTVSRLLSALESDSADELLADIPGPESLRSAVQAAAQHGVDGVLIGNASQSVDSFAALIRNKYGTRSALNAALGSESKKLDARAAAKSRTEIFNGMRRVIGVEASLWLNTMFFVPNDDEPGAVETMTLHGAFDIRRLRPGTPFYFVFGKPFVENDQDSSDQSADPMRLKDFYTNEPAELEYTELGNELCHKLVLDKLGKDAVVDMLMVSHDKRGAFRYATAESPLRGVSVVMDLPVRTLVFDLVLHKSLYPGCGAELCVYKPGARGPSNPNDPTCERDRVPTPEQIEPMPEGMNAFDVPEVPRYGEMIQRMLDALNRPIDEFRTHRLILAYPLTGFQYTMAFRAPLAPTE
ncbi:MAG: hypothetical protein Phyf2KO_08120 [Phycisphaerales bacterium]